MYIKKHNLIKKGRVITSLLLALLIVVSSIAFIPGTTANAWTSTTERTAYITTANVNVRSGPGTSHSSLGTLPKDSVIATIKGTTNGWARVDVHTQTYTQEAYISMDFLSSITTTRMYTSITSSGARKGPGTTYGLYTTHPTGTQKRVFHSKTINGYVPIDTWFPYSISSSYTISLLCWSSSGGWT